MTRNRRTCRRIRRLVLNAFISVDGYPSASRHNDDLVKELRHRDLSNGGSCGGTGIERHFADGASARSDLGVEAAKTIANGTCNRTDIDMILLRQLSPEHYFSRLRRLQQKLGLCDGPNAKFIPRGCSQASAPGFSTRSAPPPRW